MTVFPATPLLGLAAALACGLIIGIERGWHLRDERSGSRVAGVRTFGLCGLLGGAGGLLASHGYPAVAAVIVAAAAIALVGPYLARLPNGGSRSVTTTIAALLTLAFGVMATSGMATLAVAAAATVSLLLSMRQELHGWLRGVSEAEIKSLIRFAVIAAAILPLLPDARFGPYGAWNPRMIWLVVVIVTGISLAGFIASRRVGATRGILVTAALAGIYSSTAVAVSLSQRLRDGQEPASAAAGIALASAMMLLRVLLLTAILAPFALVTLLAAIGPAAVIAVAAAIWLIRKREAGAASPGLSTGAPFELGPALGFALLVAVLALVARWAEQRYGDAGVATVLAITGAIDVDAAIVTLGGLPSGTIDAATAGRLLALPVLLNTALKLGVIAVRAGWRKGLPAILPLAASALAVAAGLVTTG